VENQEQVSHDQRGRVVAHDVAQGDQDSGLVPSEESALKLLYLALQNVSKRWKPAPNWRTALNHFTLLYGDRMEAAWNRPAR
jgi:hypothetical protein